jgi:hypothetical protein
MNQASAMALGFIQPNQSILVRLADASEAADRFSEGDRCDHQSAIVSWVGPAHSRVETEGWHGLSRNLGALKRYLRDGDKVGRVSLLPKQGIHARPADLPVTTRTDHDFGDRKSI